MTTVQITASADETEALARTIGQHVRGGECFELTSDLGGGKTTFTRGLVAGMGSDDVVASPTFTISKQYDAGEKTVYHYDFYRLQEPGLVAEELAESVDDPQAVSVIEWAQTVGHVLPAQRMRVQINKQAASDTAREIVFDVPDEQAYLLEGIA